MFTKTKLFSKRHFGAYINSLAKFERALTKKKVKNTFFAKNTPDGFKQITFQIDSQGIECDDLLDELDNNIKMIKSKKETKLENI